MSTAPHQPDTYDRLVDDLSYAYDGDSSPETVATVVREARALLEPRATITQYLPIFVAKQAHERLMVVAQAEGRVASVASSWARPIPSRSPTAPPRPQTSS